MCTFILTYLFFHYLCIYYYLSLHRNGLKTRLDKVLKERKSNFPLLIKVRSHPLWK